MERGRDGWVCSKEEAEKGGRNGGTEGGRESLTGIKGQSFTPLEQHW